MEASEDQKSLGVPLCSQTLTRKVPSGGSEERDSSALECGIQRDSEGFGGIRSIWEPLGMAPVWVLDIWAPGFSACDSTPYNIKRVETALRRRPPARHL